MAIADKRLQCREIITKAVCGKGRKFSTITHTVTPPHHPTSILGAWIINHQYEAVKSGDGIEVIGSYDINIWYSYNKNSQTDVAKETISYVELCSAFVCRPETSHFHRRGFWRMRRRNRIAWKRRSSATVRPCVIRVEREFAVEMVAETKVCVAVCPGGCDEDGKDYEFGVVADQGDD